MNDNSPNARHDHTLSGSTAFSEEDVTTSAADVLGDGHEARRQAWNGADVELDEWKPPRNRKGHGDGDALRDAIANGESKEYEEYEIGLATDSDDDDDDDDDHGHHHERATLLSLPALDRYPSHASTLSLVDDVELPPLPSNAGDGKKEQQVSWSQLPRKGQLTLLTIARMSEPLAQTSLQAYMFYQLKSFRLPSGEAPSDAVVARQAGMLQAAFTGAQFLTAMLWGRAADSKRFGRKRVILIGLLGTAIGSLGFGFSRSFGAAVFWRVVGGMLNGNVGVMRTMISEIIQEKRFQSRAFLLMPMTFNIGVIIGPLLGGLLADPIGSYPQIFGPGGSLGGRDGVWWLTKWPYALPNVVNACFLAISTLALFFGLEETLEGLRGKEDLGLRVRRWVGQIIRRDSKRSEYSQVKASEGEGEDMEMASDGPRSRDMPSTIRKLSLRRIWTRNVLFTLVSHGIMAMHVGTFSNLWFVFLSTPRYDPRAAHNKRSAFADTAAPETLGTVPKDYHPHLPFVFTGGLALPPPSIGTALAILGVIGISLQLLLYPRLSFRLGTTRSFRLSILLFPISYFLTPYLATLPSSTLPPQQAGGPWVWIGITFVLTIQVLARTFALPATAILVNNSCPHPSVLGSFHGIGQSVSAGTRTIGPVLAGWLYGLGLNNGVVGLAWWAMAGVAVLGAVAGRFVKDGNGHEILLEGEREDEVDGKG